MMHEYVIEIVAHEVGHTLGLRHNFHASTMLAENQLDGREAVRGASARRRRSWTTTR